MISIIIISVKEQNHMSLRIVHENAQTTQIKELLQALDSKQLFFIERACRLEKTRRQRVIFQQWQEYLKSELGNNYSQK